MIMVQVHEFIMGICFLQNTDVTLQGEVWGIYCGF